jgi:hypothetical protein
VVWKGWKLNLIILFKDMDFGGDHQGHVSIIESRWVYKMKERPKPITYMCILCLLPGGALYHLGTVPPRRPLPDLTPWPSKNHELKETFFSL